uniref:Immunoglobulin V-set domain-containing protein n=1 Tax=Oncorhynchus mykiss TaxID=8022 RepID=A0A8C7RET3_ONCMY
MKMYGIDRLFIHLHCLWIVGYVDHTSEESLRVGETLDLKLHTPQAKKVVFQGRNSTEMTVLWMRGEEEVNSGRLKEVEGFVVLKGLKIDDCGTYTVLDSHGLLVSTVHLTVEAYQVDETQKFHEIQGKQKPIGKSTYNRSSSLRMLFVLLFSPLIQHLL